MSAAGFQGQTGLVLFFFLKSKYTEKAYITLSASPMCLDKEAKYLKCRFEGNSTAGIR